MLKGPARACPSSKHPDRSDDPGTVAHRIGFNAMLGSVASAAQLVLLSAGRHFRRGQLQSETATARADRRPIGSCSIAIELCAPDASTISFPVERRRIGSGSSVARATNCAAPASRTRPDLTAAQLHHRRCTFDAQLEKCPQNSRLFLFCSATRNRNADRERLCVGSLALAPAKAVCNAAARTVGSRRSSQAVLLFISLGLLVIVNRHHHLDHRTPHRASWLTADMAMQSLHLLL